MITLHGNKIKTWMFSIMKTVSGQTSVFYMLLKKEAVAWSSSLPSSKGIRHPKWIFKWWHFASVQLRVCICTVLPWWNNLYSDVCIIYIQISGSVPQMTFCFFVWIPVSRWFLFSGFVDLKRFRSTWRSTNVNHLDLNYWTNPGLCSAA